MQRLVDSGLTPALLPGEAHQGSQPYLRARRRVGSWRPRAPGRL